MNINFNTINCQDNLNTKQEKKVSSYINKDRMLDNFVKMAKVDTGSKDDLVGKSLPTTKGQLDLAHELSKELESIGLEDINVDKNGILTATLPSNTENAPQIGFIAHLDTAPDTKTSDVNPILHDYTEGDIELKEGTIINKEELAPYKGHTVITSDGTTLLGADDKAGIAEIIEALRVFIEHPELKRPTIKIAFTPDEEVGGGIDEFDIDKFNADVAYTVDGCEPEDIDTETFNAFNPEIVIKGIPAHCGHAYNKMVNSIGIANEFIAMIPEDETPQTTKGREGYYHIDSISGTVSETKINMLVRDFDFEKAKDRVKFINKKLDELRQKYPNAQIIMKPNEAYKNIKNYMSKDPRAIEYAKLGIQKTGLTPKENSVRGGTDGSYLTIKGLLCPNLGAGGVNFHTNKEFVSLETMEKCCENIINIAQVWVEQDKQ